MSEFYAKIDRVSKMLIGQYGDFTFFGLAKLKISPKKWDVIVCADGLPKREKEAVRLVVGELKKTLTESELAIISGVVVLDKNEIFIKGLQDLVAARQEKIYKNIIISNLSIKKLHIFQATLSLKIDDPKILEYIERMIKEQIDQMLNSRDESEKDFDVTYCQKNDDKTISNVIYFQEHKDRMAANDKRKSNTTNYSNRINESIRF